MRVNSIHVLRAVSRVALLIRVAIARTALGLPLQQPDNQNVSDFAELWIILTYVALFLLPMAITAATVLISSQMARRDESERHLDRSERLQQLKPSLSAFFQAWVLALPTLVCAWGVLSPSSKLSEVGSMVAGGVGFVLGALACRFYREGYVHFWSFLTGVEHKSLFNSALHALPPDGAAILRGLSGEAFGHNALSTEAKEALRSMEAEARNVESDFIEVGSSRVHRWRRRAAHLQGVAGSAAVAELILKFLRSRSEYTYDAMLVAEKVQPTPELLSALQKVLEAEAVIQAPAQEFCPQIQGNGKIGWTSQTQAWIKQQAATALDKLRNGGGIKSSSTASATSRYVGTRRQLLALVALVIGALIVGLVFRFMGEP